MTEEELIGSLNKWGASVVSDMVSFLGTIGKTNTGALAESLRAEARKDGENIVLEFFGNNYSEFVRQGVKGSVSSRKAPNSPFRFGSGTGEKGGLRRSIDKWVITKGISGIRDERGRFIKRKSLVFLISRKIYRFGIKPTNFVFPFFKRQDELVELIGKEFADIVLNELRSAFNGNK
jgi:hypothetical protein